MAGLRVVVVECDEDGNVDFDDLKAKAHDHADRLAALMVTYPSTHGVFEDRIVDICAVVHEFGVRCTSTAPTSTPLSAWPSRASSGPTSRT